MQIGGQSSLFRASPRYPIGLLDRKFQSRKAERFESYLKLLPQNWRRESTCFKSIGIKILATGIDSGVLQTATKSVFNADLSDGIGEQRSKKWFQRIDNKSFQIDASVKQLLSFRKLNLLEICPMRDVLDVAFCTNLILYSDGKTQNVVFEKYQK